MPQKVSAVKNLPKNARPPRRGRRWRLRRPERCMALADMAVDVTLVDRRNHHTFQPLLYQVALAVLSPAEIAQPIRSIFSKKRNIEVLMDEVIGHQARRAPGRPRQRRETASTTTSSWAPVPPTPTSARRLGPNAPGLKTVEDATEIRRRVCSPLSSPSAKW